MNTSERFTKDAITTLRNAIHEHDGNEVFAVGRLNREGSVYMVTVVARGNENAVPALIPQAEKSDVVIHNHPSGTLKPSGADLSIASQLGNQGIGFFIVDNKVERLTAVAEPVAVEELQMLDANEFIDMLAPGGKLEKVHAEYEQRPTQEAMCSFVVDAFNNNSLAVAEAGTGVGKSLAYLLPALSWAKKNRERVVISTATIVLQEQLMGKDIPLVKQLLPETPEVVLIKGRGNYLCINRLNEALEDYTMFDDENRELTAIKEWSMSTATGARDDLSFYPADSVWQDVNSESDTCLGLRCRNREDCFVLKARRQAARAHVLIVNHHLLFADLAVRHEGTGYDTTAVLPPFSRIIFDEAHRVDKSATSYFSESFSRYSVRRVLGRLYHQRKGRHGGILVYLDRKYPDAGIIQNIPLYIEAIIAHTEQLNLAALNAIQTEKSVSFQDVAAGSRQKEMVSVLKDFISAITSLYNACEEVLEKAAKQAGDADDHEEYELRIHLRRLLTIQTLAREFAQEKDPADRILWIESWKSNKGDLVVRFNSTPLDIAPIMREAVFTPYATVVFTSATLAVGGNFDFWKSRLGLKNWDERSCEEGIFPSPFPYRENVLLCLPEDPPQPGETGFESCLTQTIGEALSISEGRGLVLFTSYSLLNAVYDEIRETLSARGIDILKQGTLDIGRLLAKFRTETSSVLFATDSFWEGIDSPGETLEVVIVTRLPFRVPTEPVLKRQMELIKTAGGDPFREYSLPEAVVRLRQGFGRLIRKKTDKGVVLILDSRIVKKYYGKYFLSSLPETRVVTGETKSVLRELEEFVVKIRT
ncbi:MAG: helicase c2 [Spirochaetales bacterium]|nr:helicase c2 [Spirochaetales bacterium]